MTSWIVTLIIALWHWSPIVVATIAAICYFFINLVVMGLLVRYEAALSFLFWKISETWGFEHKFQFIIAIVACPIIIIILILLLIIWIIGQVVIAIGKLISSGMRGFRHQSKPSARAGDS